MNDRPRIPVAVTSLMIVLLASLGAAIIGWTHASETIDDLERDRNRAAARTGEIERRLEALKEARRAERESAGVAPREAPGSASDRAVEDLTATLAERDEAVAALRGELDGYRAELEDNARTIASLTSSLESSAATAAAASVRADEDEAERVRREVRLRAEAERRADELASRLEEAERELAALMATAREDSADAAADAAAEAEAEAEADADADADADAADAAEAAAAGVDPESGVAGAVPAPSGAATVDFEGRARAQLAGILSDGGDPAVIARRMGDSEITRDLLAGFLDDPDLGPRAFLALASLDSVAFDWLVARVAAGEIADDRVAGDGLRRSMSRPTNSAVATTEELKRLARHPATEVRRAGVIVAAARGDRVGAELLLELTGDDDAAVAELAATSLASPGLLRLAIPRAVARLLRGDPGDPEALARALLHPSLAAATRPRLSDAAMESEAVAALLGGLVDAENTPSPLRGVDACAELLPLGWARRDDASDWLLRLGKMIDLSEDVEVDALRGAIVNDERVIRSAHDALMLATAGDDAAMVARADDAVAGGGDALGPAIDELEAAGATPRLVARTLIRASSDPGRTDAAAIALARLRDPRATAALVGLLDRVEPDVAIEVATRLAEFGHRAGVARLARILETRELHRSSALQRLVQLGTPASLAAARGAVELGDADAAVLLVELHDRAGRNLDLASIDAIMERYELTDDAARRVLAHAAKVLGADTRAHVGELLLAERIRSKPAALRFLSTPPDAELLPLFTAQLDDEDADVRVAAVTFIGRIGPSGVLDRLLKLVTDEEPRVRRSLASVLGTVRGPACRGALVVLTKDEMWFVREAAVNALPAQENGRLIIPTLKGRLSDEVVEVRNAARMALCRLGVSEHVVELFDDLDNTHLADRTRAFLEKTFGRELESPAAWRSWWETHGRIAFGERDP